MARRIFAWCAILTILISAGYADSPVGGPTAYSYSGTTQNYTVPAGADYVVIKVWGAGGVTGFLANPGGQGGFSQAEFNVNAGETLNVSVGQGGRVGGSSVGAFNGGGIAPIFGGGGGGGYSRVTGASVAIYAGGGGGSGDANFGGLGGNYQKGAPGTGGGGNNAGSDAQNNTADGVIYGGGRGGTVNSGGSGGSEVSGGAAAQSGIFLLGGDGAFYGNARSGGGGGGGYFGGGGGGHPGGCGGGGSGYVSANGVNIVGFNHANVSDVDYAPGVGQPSPSHNVSGNDGRVVIRAYKRESVPLFNAFGTYTLPRSAPVSYQVTALGFPAPTYSASGLPPGLTMSSSGLITGYCLTPGTYTATYQATNVAGSATGTQQWVVQSPSFAAAGLTLTPTSSQVLINFTATSTWELQQVKVEMWYKLPPGTVDTHDLVAVFEGTAVAGRTSLTVTNLATPIHPPSGGYDTYEVKIRVSDVYNNHEDITQSIDLTPSTQSVPYTSTFDSFLLGDVTRQEGWVVWSGNGNIVSTAEVGALNGPARSGTKSLRVDGLSTRSRVGKRFVSTPGTLYIDYYSRFQAESAVDLSSVVDVGVTKWAWQRDGANLARLFVFKGNGVGGGVWTSSDAVATTDGTYRSLSWLRTTLRVDYSAQRFNLYVEGTAIKLQGDSVPVPIPFISNSVTSFTNIDLWGAQSSASGHSFYDDFSFTTSNPFPMAAPTGLSSSGATLTSFNCSWVPDLSSGSTLKDSLVEVQKADGTPVTTFTVVGTGTTASVTGLVPGTAYRFRVSTTNAAGIPSSASGFVPASTLADTQAPSTPSGLAASGRGDTSVSLSWSPSTDNHQVVGYDIYRDGVKLNSSLLSANSFSDSGLSPTGNYSYTVVAKDWSGNASTASSALIVGYAMDLDSDGDGITDALETRMGTNPSVANGLPLSVPTTGAVHAGPQSGFVIKSDGTLWGWGRNTEGALGDNSRTLRAAPVKANTLTNVAQVRNGFDFTLALKTDGTVWSFGNNGSGQLGNGVATRAQVPTQIPSFGSVVAVAAGTNHSVALKANGTVWVWGANATGQLGDGTTTGSTTPKQVPNLGRVVAIAAGNGWTAVLRSTGEVWTWGQDNYGQLGDGGTLTTRLSPAAIALTGVANIAAGEFHGLALLNDGTARAWGRNNFGQLGINSTTDQVSPVAVPGLSGIAEVAAGYTHSLARAGNGTVYGWGNKNFGAIGARSSTPALTASSIPGLPAAVTASGGSEYSLLLSSDGSVTALGSAYYGMVGTGTTTALRSIPYQATNYLDVISVAAGQTHSVVARLDGKVYGWGLNSSGQLGNGTLVDSQAPVMATGLTNIQKVAAGIDHSLALDSAGSVKAWGKNAKGQLGDNSFTTRNSPIQVSGLTSGVVDIVAGNSASFALKNDGTVWAWGYNNVGQLGLGNKVDRKLPVQISTANGFTGIVAIKSNSTFALALKNDGTVWSWGSNVNGQLGNGTTTESTIPIQVPGLANVTHIAAGNSFAVVRLSDGTVRSWGLNSSGQLGDNTTVQKLSPVAVPGLTGVAAVFAGGTHAVALMNDGSTRAWGSGSSGELGDGTSTQRNIPTAMLNLGANVATVSAGQGFNVVLMSDLSLRANGTNVNSQLGVLHPVPVFSAIKAKSAASDSDADGMLDSWETANLGAVTGNPSLDPDNDGLTNIEEFARGSNPNLSDADQDGLTDIVDTFPNDYFNGASVEMVIDSGNNQNSQPLTFLPSPLKVWVRYVGSQAPYVGGSVRFQVTQGGGSIATTNTGSPSLVTSLSVVTDSSGRAAVYFKQPTALGTTSKITATVGTLTTTFTAMNQGGPNDDDDGDGLTNSYEETVSMTNRFLADTDGDSISDGFEVLFGTNPNNNLEGSAAPAGFGTNFDLVIRNPNGTYGIQTSNWKIQSL